MKVSITALIIGLQAAAYQFSDTFFNEFYIMLINDACTVLNGLPSEYIQHIIYAWKITFNRFFYNTSYVSSKFSSSVFPNFLFIYTHVVARLLQKYLE